MSKVSIRQLADNASRVVADVASTGRPAIVTKHGTPVVALVPIDPEALEDWVLVTAPEFVDARAVADAELARGARGVSFDRVAHAIDDDAALDALIAEAEATPRRRTPAKTTDTGKDSRAAGARKSRRGTAVPPTHSAAKRGARRGG